MYLIRKAALKLSAKEKINMLGNIAGYTDLIIKALSLTR